MRNPVVRCGHRLRLVEDRKRFVEPTQLDERLGEIGARRRAEAAFPRRPSSSHPSRRTPSARSYSPAASSDAPRDIAVERISKRLPRSAIQARYVSKYSRDSSTRPCNAAMFARPDCARIAWLPKRSSCAITSRACRSHSSNGVAP